MIFSFPIKVLNWNDIHDQRTMKFVFFSVNKETKRIWQVNLGLHWRWQWRKKKLYLAYTLQWRGIHNRVRLQLKCALESWNLEMLVFEERGKSEYPEKNLSEQGREPTTNSTHIWRRVRETNPGHIGGSLCGRQMHNHCAIPPPEEPVIWYPTMESLIHRPFE